MEDKYRPHLKSIAHSIDKADDLHAAAIKHYKIKPAIKMRMHDDLE